MKRKTFLPILAVAVAISISACSAVNIQVNPNTQPKEEAAQEEKNETADGVPEETTEETAAPDDTEADDSSSINYPTLPLPEYHYYGPEDWADYGDIIGQYLIKEHMGDEDTAADLAICTPIILKVDDSDPKDVKVWGDFQLDSYYLMKTSLINKAGGSYPAVAHLDTSATPVVTGVDYVEDGSSFDPSFDRLFGKEGLKEAYQKESDKRVEYTVGALSYYINHNGLYITQVQEYGWAPYPIPNAPKTRDEDEIIDHTGNLGYRTKYDMRQICSLEMDDVDMFSNVSSDKLNDFLIEIRRIEGKDIDSAIKEIRSGLYDSDVELKREDNVLFAEKEGCTRLSNEGPFKDGDKVYVIYIVPRDSDFFVVATSSDYCTDDEKQMYTDDIISAFLGSLEVY